jgi:hypothetical protein
MHKLRTLDRMVAAGKLKSYSIHNVSEDGDRDKYSSFRNTELLVLEFPDGEKCEIGTFCSGSAENTCFIDP